MITKTTVIFDQNDRYQNDRYKSDLKNNSHFGHGFSGFNGRFVKSKMVVVQNSRNNGHLSIK